MWPCPADPPWPRIPSASPVAAFPGRLLSTVVYLICVWYSFRIPDAITSYNGPTRTLHLWWGSIELPTYVQQFTLYPAVMLTTFALVAYLDASRQSFRALIIALISAALYFGFWFLALLLFIALDSDNHVPDGNVVPRHFDADGYLTLAFAIALCC